MIFEWIPLLLTGYMTVFLFGYLATNRVSLTVYLILALRKLTMPNYPLVSP